MSFRSAPRPRTTVVSRVAGVACAHRLAFAQNAATGETSTLRGQVTDPSGSFVTTATIVLTTPSGDAITAQTDKNGNYEIKGLVGRKIRVEGDCDGFTDF